MIKAVIFDIDGVLIDSFEANWKFHQELMTKAGYKPASREEYKKMFPRTMLDNIKTITKSNSEEEIQRIFQMGVKREVRYPVELLSSPKHIRDTIELLSQNYFLGIMTSRIKNSVFEPPIMKEIENYFKVEVSFEDTNNHKPNPEPLLLIIEKLNLNPEEIVYIGDAETDFQAARSAGIKFILFPKSNIKGVDISTNIFSELPDLIKKL
jgi:HAD superfamily hydrolase (TIGR01549 family)